MGEDEGYPEDRGPRNGDLERIKETEATEAHGDAPDSETACGDEPGANAAPFNALDEGGVMRQAG